MKRYVVVFGSNPASGKRAQTANSTLPRVARWMGECGIDTYDFANVIERHVEIELFADVNSSRVSRLALHGDRVVTLGRFASQVMTRLGIVHYALPHPSPRNRQFNDPMFEDRTLAKLKSSGYLS